MEEEEEACIAQLFGLKGNKKKKKKNKKNNTKPKRKAETVLEDSAPANNDADDEANANATPASINNGGDDDVNASNNNSASSGSSSSRVRVSPFDYTVENFFRYIDTVATLCGEEQNVDFKSSEIQRFTSSVTFLRYIISIYKQKKRKKEKKATTTVCVYNLFYDYLDVFIYYNCF